MVSPWIWSRFEFRFAGRAEMLIAAGYQDFELGKACGEAFSELVHPFVQNVGGNLRKGVGGGQERVAATVDFGSNEILRDLAEDDVAADQYQQQDEKNRHDANEDIGDDEAVAQT